MGFADTMRILTGLQCGAQSTLTYLKDKKAGADTGSAVANLVGNVANGLVRNEFAYQMQKDGNCLGNLVNTYAGYGNPVSNSIGTIGLMNACSPWMYFNCCCSPSMMMGYGIPGYGMGMGGFGMGMGLGGLNLGALPWGSSVSISQTISYRC